MRAVRTFIADRRAVAGTEFALILPLLLFIVIGTAVFYDYFRHRQSLERSLYTVGDILSRHSIVDDDDIDFMHDLMAELMSANPRDIDLQVTSIERNSETTSRQIWQENRGLAWTGAPASTDSLPDIAVGDSVVIVQALLRYSPPLVFDLFDIDRLENAAAYRPRFVSAITYN